MSFEVQEMGWGSALLTDAFERERREQRAHLAEREEAQKVQQMAVLRLRAGGFESEELEGAGEQRQPVTERRPVLVLMAVLKERDERGGELLRTSCKSC
jgi:hypothetical protein